MFFYRDFLSMVSLGNRTIEKSIAAVKGPDKLFKNVCALIQGLLGRSKLVLCPAQDGGAFYKNKKG